MREYPKSECKSQEGCVFGIPFPQSEGDCDGCDANMRQPAKKNPDPIKDRGCWDCGISLGNDTHCPVCGVYVE